jgi:predicted DCC family thiol-disulfide oxidoreductase YuxK
MGIAGPNDAGRTEAGRSTLYFDGVCNLCNHFVDFLITRDVTGHLKFASLQGETARSRLPNGMVSGLSSVVFEDAKGQIYTRSAAALRAIAELGGSYRAILIFLGVPALLRDWLYDFIATRRYSWFGKRETCRLPTAAERARFLD